MFLLLLTRTVRKLRVTICSFMSNRIGVFLAISLPPLLSSPLSFHTSLHSFVSVHLHPLFCLLFYSSFHQSLLSLSPTPLTPPGCCGPVWSMKLDFGNLFHLISVSLPATEIKPGMSKKLEIFIGAHAPSHTHTRKQSVAEAVCLDRLFILSLSSTPWWACARIHKYCRKHWLNFPFTMNCQVHAGKSPQHYCLSGRVNYQDPALNL